jgi:hypothetical protein
MVLERAADKTIIATLGLNQTAGDRASDTPR